MWIPGGIGKGISNFGIVSRMGEKAGTMLTVGTTKEQNYTMSEEKLHIDGEGSRALRLWSLKQNWFHIQGQRNPGFMIGAPSEKWD